MNAPSDAPEPLDLSEKGRLDGRVISLDRRIFMKFTAFGDCDDPAEPVAVLEETGLTAALYLDANDPRGIGVMAATEEPGDFVTTLRGAFNARPFAELVHKPEFDMLGRSYTIGYEPDLENVLIDRPKKRLLNAETPWAIWYPLQRAKSFQRLPDEDQKRILAEHGRLAHRYASGGHATDIRLACHGLDKNDNDFIVGLLGPKLHPLSAVVQEMRKTEQTAQYLDSLGPFFVGKAVWQSAS